MATSSEIKARAKALAEKTDVNSIAPKEVGGIMYDLASHSENVLRNGGTLGIRKVYESVSAMEADGINPVDLWGNPIKKGNLVVIYDGTTTGVDNNKVYAFMNPGWTLATELDAGYATKEELSELGSKVGQTYIINVPSGSGWYLEGFLNGIKGNVFIKRMSSETSVSTVIYEDDASVGSIFDFWKKISIDTELAKSKLYVSSQNTCSITILVVEESVLMNYIGDNYASKNELLPITESVELNKDSIEYLNNKVAHLNNKIEGSAAVREHKEFKNGEWVSYEIPSTNKVSLSVSPSIDVYMSLGAKNSSSEQIWGATHLLKGNEVNTFEITANDVVLVELKFTSNISASVEIKTEEDTDGLEGQVEELYNFISDAIHEIHVVKDGSGDYTSIQDAINSITDNRANNRYIVYVHDDWYVEDLTELVLQNNPAQHSQAVPTQGCALFVTKDFVTVKGYGRKVNISVSPSNKDLPTSAFPNIHAVFMWGHSGIENMHLELKGGRYTIHQDIGVGGDNKFRTLSIKNCVVIHQGNDDYPNSEWSAQAAFGIGTSDGETIKIEDSKFVSPYLSPILSHSNNSFTKGNVWIFDKVEIACSKSTELRRLLTYMNDYGSGQKSYVYITGCNFPVVPFGNSAIQSTSDFAHCNLHDNGGFKINGYGNVKSTARIEAYSGLIVCSKNMGENVDIVGGTAYNDVWVSTFKSYKSDANSYGVAIGSARIAGGNFLLGKRLGDCSVTNKTLIVRIGSNNYTLTLTDNYSDMSENDVLAKLNALNSNIVFNSGGNAVYAAYNSFMGTMAKLDVYNDCKETGVNVGSSALYPMQLVVRDRTKGYNAWRIASVDENPEGVVGERIDVGSNGDILLIGKSYFGGRCPNQSQTQSYFAQFTDGRSYGVGADGYPTLKDNGALIAIDSNFLEFKM